MTLSTFSAGLLITIIAVSLELLDKDNKKKADEFMNME